MILNYYETIQSKIEKLGTNWSSCLWITSILMIPLEFAMVVHGVWHMCSGVQSESVFLDVWWYYAICLGMIPFGLPIGNIISAIIFGLVLKDKYNSITTNPISCRALCSKNKKWIIFILHCVMISVIVYGAQLILFVHGYFIFLALIASPYHTFAMLLLSTTYLCVIIIYFTLISKAFKRKKLHGFFVFFIGCALLIVFCLCIVTFVKITMLGGSYYSSGVILSVIMSLVPSAILAGFGYLGGKALTYCNEKQNNGYIELSDVSS